MAQPMRRSYTFVRVFHVNDVPAVFYGRWEYPLRRWNFSGIPVLDQKLCQLVTQGNVVGTIALRHPEVNHFLVEIEILQPPRFNTSLARAGAARGKPPPPLDG